MMAGSVNKVILIGNLGRDPEIRHSQDGTKIVTLSVATSESWKDRSSGERRERTEWHRVVIFHPGLADIAERYLRKGAKAYLEGALQTRKWADQSGIERSITEVVVGRFRGELTLLDSRSVGVGSHSSAASLSSSYDPSPLTTGPSAARAGSVGGTSDVVNDAGWDRSSIPDLDDEIPF
ncbi:Single-stranded DNA-binding protein [invertebrate metagenome]|uniref:Single-stranded DNA-binding protein n=1 Tax=invertebrate metagenome TaxID=1711999 RepID=A0A484H9Z1_9ZZZZ